MAIEVQITSLKELLKHLPHCGQEDYNALARDMHLDTEELLQYATWKSSRYTRNCIVRTDKYELILLCWQAGQATSIHCHGGEECWVYAAKGLIEEVHFTAEDNCRPLHSGSHILEEGQVSYMNDEIGYHKLQNVGAGKALSLHLYMNPIDQCTCWNEELQLFVPTDLTYDTYRGRPV